MNQNGLTEEVVTKAIDGDEKALERILDHFDEFINQLATGFFVDGAGKVIRFVDPEVKAALQKRILKSTIEMKKEEQGELDHGQIPGYSES